ncbi:MAG: hypothetical protein RLY31_1436 [Bacteroidota bacterium]
MPSIPKKIWRPVTPHVRLPPGRSHTRCRLSALLLLLLAGLSDVAAYPIDGYRLTGIRRLLRLEWILTGELKGAAPLPGATKRLADIRLHLAGPEGEGRLPTDLPPPDPTLQQKLRSLFPRLDESYSIALLDISPGKPVRYASQQADRGFQPGSVGKLAVISALFCELENIYPDSFALRRALLKDKLVRGGPWVVYDEHTVPFFDPETRRYFRRQIREDDVLSLYEWADHMLSPSNNGAATVVWREAVLMRVFGKHYPSLTYEQGEAYFRSTPRSVLSEIAVSVVGDPLVSAGISPEEWRLGQLFTRGGTRYIPGKGGSVGSPKGLMKWMVTLEKGELVDDSSSLEIKRLLYLTDTRIRYAANRRLRTAALYFKSGSLYSCRPEEGFSCGKYQGNVVNYMNSVAIVEHGDSTVYLVALMSNVLRKNSNADHNTLAGRIDALVRE